MDQNTKIHSCKVQIMWTSKLQISKADLEMIVMGSKAIEKTLVTGTSQFRAALRDFISFWYTVRNRISSATLTRQCPLVAWDLQGTVAYTSTLPCIPLPRHDKLGLTTSDGEYWQLPTRDSRTGLSDTWPSNVRISGNSLWMWLTPLRIRDSSRSGAA